VVCQDETRDWLGSEVPKMNAWECSRLRIVGLEALPIYKSVLTWFLGPAEGLFNRLRTLNRGLDTSQWRVYERQEVPSGVRLGLGIDSQSVLEGLRWRHFSCVGQAVFSLFGAKPEAKK
jgi:hypothetical protein